MLRLRELRQDRKLSRLAFAQKMGISESTVGGYENGNRTPNIQLLMKMARYFGVSVDYLIGYTDNPDPFPDSSTHLITREERRFVEGFRKLPPADQQLFQQLMDRFPKREKPQDEPQ